MGNDRNMLALAYGNPLNDRKTLTEQNTALSADRDTITEVTTFRGIGADDIQNAKMLT